MYFGEGLDGFVIVDAKQKELNYARQGVSDSRTRYRGRDGVDVGSFFRKAAFALRFGDPNILISGQMTDESRILMRRDIRERVEKLAPFLDFDADPYPVIADGKTTWILDGYTTSTQYPYSQLTQGSGGLSGDLNYARNSVKVTIDAYQGTVKFYVIDPDDPIIQAYQKAFPDLFTSFDEMPETLVEHLRYPEDLFKVQSDTFSKYHVVEPQRFYNGNERWLLSPDPNAAVTPIASDTPSGRNQNTNRAPEITAETRRQDPYYLYIRLPGDDRESFLILQPFVPVSKDNQQTRLVSFMSAKSDPRDYGELEAFVMPQGQQVLGPVQAAANIQKTTEISSEITLLSQRGSNVLAGAVQLIPVGESIIYVQPFFTVAAQNPNAFPQFQFVTVAVPDPEKSPVKADTVSAGLDALFGRAAAEPTDPNQPTEPSQDQDVEQLLESAEQKFADAQAALTAGDLGEYQQLVGEAQDLVEQARQLLVASGGGTPTSSTSSTTSTTGPASQQALSPRP
jgi:uncharacterized membrane protein (UPF0182 family)